MVHGSHLLEKNAMDGLHQPGKKSPGDPAMAQCVVAYNADLINSRPHIFDEFGEFLIPFEPKQNLANLGEEEGLSESTSLERNSQLFGQTSKINPPNHIQRWIEKALEHKKQQFADLSVEIPKIDEPKATENLTIVGSADLSIAEITLRFKELLEPLFKLTDSGASARQLEEETWKVLQQIGQQSLGQLWARRSAHVSEAEIKKTGLSPESVQLRMDRDYNIEVTTTFGEIILPLFAFRVKQADGKIVTHAPAREELFPYHRQCR